MRLPLLNLINIECRTIRRHLNNGRRHHPEGKRSFDAGGCRRHLPGAEKAPAAAADSARMHDRGLGPTARVEAGWFVSVSAAIDSQRGHDHSAPASGASVRLCCKEPESDWTAVSGC